MRLLRFAIGMRFGTSEAFWVVCIALGSGVNADLFCGI